MVRGIRVDGPPAVAVGGKLLNGSRQLWEHYTVEGFNKVRTHAGRDTQSESGYAQLPAQDKPATESVSQITYSQTRSVSLDRSILADNHVILAPTAPPIIAAYSLLRTQVLQRLAENNWNSIAVTSPSMGEGKTLTAINLAVSLARDVSHTVLLVDLDLRRPAIHKTLGVSPEFGVSDYLTRDVPIQTLLFTIAERLVVLPGRVPVDNPAELLSSPRMAELADELKRRYASRIVIFDLPPLLSSDDTMAFAPNVDAALLVIEEDATTIEDAENALMYLKSTPIVGTVLNKSEQEIEAYLAT